MLQRAVDAHEGLAGDRKARLHHRAFRALLARAVTADVGDGGIPEQRDVEIHRLLAFAVENQEGLDFLIHRALVYQFVVAAHAETPGHRCWLWRDCGAHPPYMD